MPKEEIRLRLEAAAARRAVSTEARAYRAKQTEDSSPDTDGLQETLKLTLDFVRKVKNPLRAQRARAPVDGGPDEKQLAEIADVESDIKKQIHSRLVRS